MRPPSLPYHIQIGKPPRAIRKAKLDNIALVPASLLPFKADYQDRANKLPTGSVLCVPGTPRQQKIIASVKEFFRTHGHTVYTLPLEKISRKMQKPRPAAENLKLAL